MKMVIIGSTQYKSKFEEVKLRYEAKGYEVKIPAFDDNPELNELEICEYNLELIKWADLVCVIWDRRSIGTIFDFGMVFALGKPIIIEYLEPKTFSGVIEKYEMKTKK